MTDPSDRGCCALCGARLRAPRPGEEGHARCEGCGRPHWDNTIPVAGVLVVREGRVLLTRRDQQMQRAPGRWAFPGGFVEAGESAEEGALRETREEAGLDATITGIVGRPHAVRDPAHLVIVYRGEADGDPRAGSETAETRWFAPGELPWGELAFSTTVNALRDLLAEGLDGPPAHPHRPPPPQPLAAPAPPAFCRRCGGRVRRASGGADGHGRCSLCATAVWRNPVCGAAMHVLREGRVLLARRGPRMRRGAGRWTAPGGHIEPGESAEEAVVRELREEVALEVEVSGLTGVYSVRDPAIVHISYRGTASGEPHPADETAAVRWFGPHELPWGELFEDAVAPLRDLVARGLN